MKHREAYCLMNYRCEACGAEEVLWNSRDGVTPFSIPCISCGADSLTGMTHVHFERDRLAPLYSPRPGQRYFADMSPERARAAANRNADRLVSMGRIPSNDRNRVSDDLFRDYYRDGTAPDILRVPTPRPPIPTQVTIAPRGYSWHGDRLQKDELGTLTRKPQAKGD